MTLREKPLIPEQLLKNNPKKEGHYQRLGNSKCITSGLCDDELFIGSVSCSDLSILQKKAEKSDDRFYKRFSLTPTNEI